MNMPHSCYLHLEFKMSERIKELAAQAKFDVGQIIAEVICPDCKDADVVGNAWNTLPADVRKHIVDTLTSQQQKFAGLIVEECANIALKSGSVSNKSEQAKAEAERIYDKIQNILE